MKFVEDWIRLWNIHDLEGVLSFMADDVEFEHWNGHTVRGKQQLRRAWRPWFAAHGDFHFEVRSICAEPSGQKLSFEWKLEWPSPEPTFAGQREVRDGIDFIELEDGKVVSKRTYIKTTLTIDGKSIALRT